MAQGDEGSEKHFLYFAIRSGDTKMVEALIEKGVNINEQDHDNDKTTPLHLAIESGHTEIAKFLIEKGADVNRRNRGGRSTLHFAAMIGNTEMVEALIEKGVNINEQDRAGRKPLHFAIESAHTEIIKVLIEKGVDVNKQDQDYERITPLQLAIESGSTEMVQEIIRYAILFDFNIIKPDCIANNTALSQFWDECETELAKQYSSDSSISLRKFLLETDQNKLAGYMSGLQEALEESQHISVYRDMIGNNLDKGKERKHLLCECEASINSYDSIPKLDSEVFKARISSLLTNVDLENLIEAFAGLPGINIKQVQGAGQVRN